VIKKTIQKPRYEEVMTQVGMYDVDVYETSDGREFYQENQAKQHEWEISMCKSHITFPLYAETFHFQSIEDIIEFEKTALNGYCVKKMYDESEFTFPNIFATYTDQSQDEQDDYVEEVYMVPFSEFKQKIIDELNSIK
jgi:hypothetical protein